LSSGEKPAYTGTMKLHYDVNASDFSKAGVVSGEVKKLLKVKRGVPAEVVRNVAIAMYEAEINMVIHANGGHIDIEITEKEITIIFADKGPGIPDIAKAQQAGFSTACENIRSLGFGAGMGIPNMKKYADFLDIKSEVGVGTTVTMKIFL